MSPMFRLMMTFASIISAANADQMWRVRVGNRSTDVMPMWMLIVFLALLGVLLLIGCSVCLVLCCGKVDRGVAYEEQAEDVELPKDALRAVNSKCIVIGITGVSRSGKGWVANGVVQAMEALGKRVTILHQDDFIFQGCEVEVNGKIRESYEEPECANHEKLCAEIQENTFTHDVVIAEGSHVVFNPLTAAQLNHIFLLELDEAEAKRRRTQPFDEKLNPDPISAADFDDLLWPAHERYMTTGVRPLGRRVIELKSPSNASQRDDVVNNIIGIIQDRRRKDSVSSSGSYTYQDKPPRDSMMAMMSLDFDTLSDVQSV